MINELEEFENEKKQAKHDLYYGKKRITGQLKKNRQMIKENKGEFKYTKRLFLLRWYEKIVKNIRLTYNRFILWLFNNR
jgi:hypothetical protein